jgi:integrase
VTCTDLFRDERLLGRALVDDTSPTLGTRFSKWTLAQRRSGIRDLVTLMRPELLTVLGEEPNARLDRALRSVAERVGGGYRLTSGAPRRRGGRAPTGEQLRAVLHAVAAEPGYQGARHLAFFTILAKTGSRVNALRNLDGTDCVELSSGRLRIFLHQKGDGEARELELSRVATDALRGYIAAFNRHAALRRWRVRVSLGEPGVVWCDSSRAAWPAEAIRSRCFAKLSMLGIVSTSPG